MNDENHHGATEQAQNPAGDQGAEQAQLEQKGAVEQIEADQEKIFDPALKRDAAVKDFVKNSHPVELLKAIEEQVRVLKLLIHGIPDGVVHGWHSLAAEISLRGF